MQLDIGQVVCKIESKYGVVEVCEIDAVFFRLLLVKSSTDEDKIIGYDVARLLDDDGVPLEYDQIPSELRDEYPGFRVMESEHPGLRVGEVFPTRK